MTTDRTAESDLTAPDPRLPIGPIQELPGRDRAALHGAAARMSQATGEWRTLLEGLDSQGLDNGELSSQELDRAALKRRYRSGSWTVHELAHHVADAHLHGLNRLRSALTTPGYVIQPFDQDAWLTLPDAGLPVSVALNLLDAATAHWAALLDSVEVARFDRQILHLQEGQQELWQLVAKHDWHLRHHLAQARLALESAG